MPEDNRFNDEMFKELEQELSDNKMNREIIGYAKRLGLYYNTLLEQDNIDKSLAEELLFQYQDLMLRGSTFI